MVMRVTEPMARPKAMTQRTFAGLGLALALVLALPTLGSAEPPGVAKKVGTERIVVTPPTQAPAAATPTAPTPPPTAPAPAAAAGGQSPSAAAAKAPSGPPPEVHKGEEGLPPAVAKMRRRLLDAAYSGDLQRLKVAMQVNEMPPVVSVNEVADPIEHLKAQSGDGQGLEILAILTDVLEASWARINVGTPQEMYVWPSFVALPLDRLDPAQTVEIYKILTSSDLEEMKSVGRYTFYNVGIGPDGTWHWFKPAD